MMTREVLAMSWAKVPATPNADGEEQRGNENVQPVLAAGDGKAAALRLEQDQEHGGADAVADQAHRPRRDLVERDPHRGPAQPPAEAQRHQQKLGDGGVAHGGFGGHGLPLMEEECCIDSWLRGLAARGMTAMPRLR